MDNYLLKYTQLSGEEYEKFFHQEGLLTDTAVAFEDELLRQGKNISFLAEAMNKTKGFISRVLRGDANLTLRTLSDLAYALNCRIVITLEDCDNDNQD